MKDEYQGIIYIMFGLALGFGGFFFVSELFIFFTLVCLFGIVKIMFPVNLNTKEAKRSS